MHLVENGWRIEDGGGRRSDYRNSVKVARRRANDIVAIMSILLRDKLDEYVGATNGGTVCVWYTVDRLDVCDRDVEDEPGAPGPGAPVVTVCTETNVETKVT
jgi:hypothetical protein